MTRDWNLATVRRGVLLSAIVALVPHADGLSAQTRLTRPLNLGTPVLLVAGPAPVSPNGDGTPAYFDLWWAPPPAPPGGSTTTVYAVHRWLESDIHCCQVLVTGLTSPQWTDASIAPPGAYNYRITAFHSNNSVGSVDVRWVRPAPVNPARVWHTLSGNNVYLQWDPVWNVSWYEVTGPGLGFPSFQLVGQTTMPAKNLPSGTHTWTIGSFFAAPNSQVVVSTPASQFRVITVIVPQ